ncbi:MAG: hypothetical protein AABX51_04550 [Nanoarchaeota archaeon]
MGLLSKGMALERNMILNKQNLSGKLNTDIDRFYYMVRSAGSVRISFACKTLNIKRKQIEEYASILADRNLIVIKRSLFSDLSFEIVEQKDKSQKITLSLIILWNAP